MLATGAACLPLLVVPINLAAPPFVRAPTLALARCLETLGRERELALGLGRFWDTYPVLFASGGKIRVLTMNGTVPARHWANDLAWYAPRGDGRRFTFIIMSNQWPDHEALRAAYGLPAEVLECARLGPGYGDSVIWAYDRAGAERLTAARHRGVPGAQGGAPDRLPVGPGASERTPTSRRRKLMSLRAANAALPSLRDAP